MNIIYFETLSFGRGSDPFYGVAAFHVRRSCFSQWVLSSIALLNSLQGPPLFHDHLQNRVSPWGPSFFSSSVQDKCTEIVPRFCLTGASDKEDLQAQNSLEQQPKKQITFKKHNVVEETACGSPLLRKRASIYSTCWQSIRA